MILPVEMVEIWRGSLLESRHSGHAVICDGEGGIVRAWGDPQALIYPRSSCKMVQALPLITSGAAQRFGLGQEQLALSCASHNGAAIHTDRVRAWLDTLGLEDGDFRCGPQVPDDEDARNALIQNHENPCQVHNNCSGKHAGFLTLNRHLGGDAEYISIDHPVQLAVREAFEEVTGAASPDFGIDGCSAPNFQTTLAGLARAMGRYASAHERSDPLSRAAVTLREAMMAHPDLVAGEGRACTILMRAMRGRAAVKTGAEGVFVAILPERKLGIALKISDGATRASECALTAILVGLGVLEADDPAARALMMPRILNRRGIDAGHVRPVPGVF